MKKTTKVDTQIAELDVIFDSLIRKSKEDVTNTAENSGVYSAMEDVLKLKKDLLEIKEGSKSWKSRVDVNTVISAGVSLTSMLLILNYEKTDIVTSKAFTVASKWFGK